MKIMWLQNEQYKLMQEGLRPNFKGFLECALEHFCWLAFAWKFKPTCRSVTTSYTSQSLASSFNHKEVAPWKIFQENMHSFLLLLSFYENLSFQHAILDIFFFIRCHDWHCCDSIFELWLITDQKGSRVLVWALFQINRLSARNLFWTFFKSGFKFPHFFNEMQERIQKQLLFATVALASQSTLCPCLSLLARWA